jgi:hypothetical protein
MLKLHYSQVRSMKTLARLINLRIRIDISF